MSNRSQRRGFLVVGGGAAGFFGAITAAECAPSAEVLLAEAGPQTLAKVRISGGGRCNVTHACFDPAELVKRYPRGGRELRGPFSRFGPRDTIAWFAARGVALKTEADGRMFPVTDSSSTILQALRSAAAEAGVDVRTRLAVQGLSLQPDGRFRARFGDGTEGEFDKVLVATGGNRGSAGLDFAKAFGHTIEPPVPSLFTFNLEGEPLRGLEGVSVPEARVAVLGTGLEERGPLLVTHWGLSGPAVLKLSAWGARELAARDYRFPIEVSWTPGTPSQVLERLQDARRAEPRKQLGGFNPLGLPQRLWERGLEATPGAIGATWASVPKAILEAVARAFCCASYQVSGKSVNKDEFVTCGGVRLRELDFKTMQSRLVPGLHFAGEVLDVDGVTGGFNFQAAWTTGWHAGRSMAGVNDL